MSDITDAEFYIERLESVVDADDIKAPLGTGDLSFRALYGKNFDGGSTATVVLDESMPYTDVSATVKVKTSAWGAFKVNMDDIRGQSWNYFLSGIFSLSNGGSILMQVNLDGTTYYDGDKRDGDIRNFTKEVIVEFSGVPYGDKVFGGDHDTVAGLIDKKADDARGWAIDFIDQIESMTKG